VADDDVRFRTDRTVVVRRWRAVDLEGYAELNADPEVMTFLGGPMTREQSDALARYGESWAEQGMGLLPVVRAEDGVLLGMCGLHRHRWYPDEVEIGWRFARQAWGNGYATEAARGWLDVAFRVLELDHVISMTDPGNHRSRAVMRRLGMQPRRQGVHLAPDGGRITVVVYALAARDR
jgi:RimJ/RimL family protein N-acetyltransferase